MNKISEHIHSSENRNEILSKTTNLEYLKHLLGGDIFDDDKGKFKFKNNNFVPPNYVETEKFGVLFHMKGGSSFISNALTLSNLITTPSTRYSSWPNVFKSVMRIDNMDSESEEYPEFIKILNGKSIKDLILVTRNPIYKWISGVYQEMQIEYGQSKTLKFFLKEKYKGVNISEKMDNLPDEAFEELCYTILKSVFESGGGSTWAHAMLYNETYYNFLELNPNIDKSKLKIIDIDSPNGNLTSLLSAYHPEILSLDYIKNFHSHRFHYERLFKIIRKRIFHGNEPTLLNDITKQLQTQYYYYTMLEHKYSEYFI